MITQEFLRETLEWAKRELRGFGPLALEGQMLKAIILMKRSEGMSLSDVEEDVVNLNTILEKLQQERRFANSRQVIQALLSNIPDFQAHREFLENYPGLEDSKRAFLISTFERGENYG